MAITKAALVDEILDLLATVNITVREILTEALPEHDVDEYVLSLMPTTTLAQAVALLHRHHSRMFPYR